MTDGQPLQGAVIGCGRMGAFTSASVLKYGPACWLPLAHAEAIANAEGVELAALCDPDEAARDRAAQHYGVSQTYPSHGALLSAKAPDIAGIATRTPGRAQMIADCVEAGTRALHIEKPICNSVNELEQLEELLARPDIFMTLGAIRRHFAIYQEAIIRAQSGEFGALLEAHAQFGARSLFWSHPHTVDLILLAANGARVQAVQARLGNVERDGSVVDNDPIVEGATIWFESGFAGHITRMPGTDFRLACETAQISVLNNGQSLWQSGREKPGPDTPPISDPAGANPYHDQQQIDFSAGDKPQGTLAPILQLRDCVLDADGARAANRVVKHDIVTGQRILFAMVQSHLEDGRPVPLADVDPDIVVHGRTGQFFA